MSEPRIIVLTAPSGSGKTTIARALVQAIPEIRFSVSATTRPPRANEHDGIDYYFVSEGRFREMISEGALVEHEEVYPGLFYGTLRSEVDRATSQQPVLLDVDVRGAESVKRIFGDDALIVFIRPPSLEALAERLRTRGTETETSLRNRLARAEEEIRHESSFDRIIINDELDNAIAETIGAVRGFLAVSAGS